DLSDARAHAVERGARAVTVPSVIIRGPVMRAPEKQPTRGGVRRRCDLVGQTAETPRPDHARAHAELVAGGAGHALEKRPAAGQDEARLESVCRPRRLYLGPDELEDLGHPRFHDLGDVPAGHAVRGVLADR